jgi:hypothetical protein
MVFPLLLQLRFRLAAGLTIVAAILILVKTRHELFPAWSSAAVQIGRPDGFNIALRGFRKRC